jgi:hypothetical protein
MGDTLAHAGNPVSGPLHEAYLPSGGSVFEVGQHDLYGIAIREPV